MEKIIKYFFFGFSFLLSFKTTLSNFFVILILISFIIQFIILKEKKIRFGVMLHSFIPLFVFSLFSLLWSSNKFVGIDLLLRYIPILLIPLIFSIVPLKHNKLYLKYSYYGLLIGSIILSFLLFWRLGVRLSNLEVVNINRIFSSHQTSHKYTSEIINIHPSYLGLYSLLSIAVLLFNKIKVKNTIKIVLYLILLVNILFLNARILFLLLGILVIIKFFSIESVKIKIVIFSSFVFLVITSLIFLQNTYLYKKLIKGSLWEISHNAGTHNTTDKYPSDSRLVRWKSAIEGTKNHRIIGSGIGTEMDVLLPMYKKNKLIVSHYRKFNTHNQYLYYLITTGVIGLILFLYLLLYNIFISIKNRDLIMFYFFTMLFFISLVENVMYRNAGFIFIAIYISLYNKQYLHK